MSTTEIAHEQDKHGYAYKLGTNRLGLWLFIISDSFVFGALLITRFYLLGTRKLDLEPLLGLSVTVILLISSFFMNRAEVMISLGNRKGFITSTLVTMLLGIAFLIGVIGVEWQLAPFKAGGSAEGAVFYMMTGMHAFHVFSGVIFLYIILRNGLRGKYSPERHWGVEACANYWHFVDVVWVFFYPALYLIGKLG
jgi:cytochrome c oxidase subunit 3